MDNDECWTCKYPPSDCICPAEIQYIDPEPLPERTMRANDLINAQQVILGERGAERDSPDGERSMAHTVAIFNVITKHSLTEREGWMFMQALKIARNQRKPSIDGFVDLANYVVLEGEAAKLIKE